MIVKLSFEAAHMSALALEREAMNLKHRPRKRRQYQETADALWSILNDTDAIELDKGMANDAD